MTLPYASGKQSLGTCDFCGQLVPYTNLRRYIQNMKDTGLRLCTVNDCWSPDQEQFQVGKWPITDPQALQYARPDLLTDRGLCGFNPVHGNIGVATVGQVKVS